jgi:hypothetical protein
MRTAAVWESKFSHIFLPFTYERGIILETFGTQFDDLSGVITRRHAMRILCKIGVPFSTT